MLKEDGAKQWSNIVTETAEVYNEPRISWLKLRKLMGNDTRKPPDFIKENRQEVYNNEEEKN